MALLRSKYFTNHTDTENDRLLHSKTTYEAYKMYCKRQRVAKRNIIPNQKEFNLAISALSKGVGQLIVEKKSGLFIKDFGYFFVFRSYGHTYKRTRTGKKFYNLIRGGIRARIIFQPDETDFHMKFWTFENRFVRAMQLAVTEKMNEGFSYIGMPYTVGQMLGKRITHRFKRYPKKFVEDEQ